MSKSEYAFVCSCCIGIFMSTICYVASIFGILLMYVFYASNLSCTLNIFFITWTGILLTVMMIITLHSKVSFFPEFMLFHFISCQCHDLKKLYRLCQNYALNICLDRLTGVFYLQGSWHLILCSSVGQP